MTAPPSSSTSSTATTASLLTPPGSGAIALIQVHGPATRAVLRELTGRDDWAIGPLRLVPLAEIDHGLAGLLRDDLAHLMPHGGPYIVQQLLARLTQLGAPIAAEPQPLAVYPEAGCPLEALALRTLAHAASPAAADRLLRQVDAWTAWAMSPNPLAVDRILEVSAVLDRLVMPPTIVVMGPANAGKSTLANAMTGRTLSVVADLPGTTRDWVGGLCELGQGDAALAVRWVDTPGIRDGADAIERAAIDMIGPLWRDATLRVALGAPDTGLLDAYPQPPHLHVLNKADLLPTPVVGDGSPATPLPIAARDGDIIALRDALLAKLLPGPLDPNHPWAFDNTIRDALIGPDPKARINHLLARAP